MFKAMPNGHSLYFCPERNTPTVIMTMPWACL